MKRAGLMLVLATGFAVYWVGGCAKPGERLIGRWEMDTDSMTEQAPEGGEKSAGAQLVEGFAKILIEGSGIKAEMEFKPDGTGAFTGHFLGESKTVSGQWKVEKAEGDQLTLQLKLDGEDEFNERIVTFLDDDHVQASPPGTNTVLKFRRIKKAQ